MGDTGNKGANAYLDRTCVEMAAAVDSMDFDCMLQKLKNYTKARLSPTKFFISDNRKTTSALYTKNAWRMSLERKPRLLFPSLLSSTPRLGVSIILSVFGSWILGASRRCNFFFLMANS